VALARLLHLAAQTGEYFVTRNELHFSSLDLADAALDLDSPCLFDIVVYLVVIDVRMIHP
jgi:hypothetical protein